MSRDLTKPLKIYNKNSLKMKINLHFNSKNGLKLCSKIGIQGKKKLYKISKYKEKRKLKFMLRTKPLFNNIMIKSDLTESLLIRRRLSISFCYLIAASVWKEKNSKVFKLLLMILSSKDRWLVIQMSKLLSACSTINSIL